MRRDITIPANRGSFNCSSYEANSGYTCYDNSSRALFPVEQNTKTRFRIINMGGFATFQFAIDNHTMTVIEGDSTMVEPLELQILKIASAQRYSFVLNANQTAQNYWMRAEMDTNCFFVQNPVLNPTVLGILAYGNNTALPGVESVGWNNPMDPLCEDLNSTLLVPSVVQQAPPADNLFVIQVSFQIGDDSLDLAYINGTSYKVSQIPTLNWILPHLRAGNTTFNQTGAGAPYGLQSQYILDIPDNQVVDILIQNFDDGSHPFHLHGYEFWVMASSQEQYFPWEIYDSLNTTNPMRRDTVMVDAYGWTLIRIQADNPGLWAFHCHISWHVAAGLLMQLQTRDDLMKDWTIPNDVLELCPA
jgi:FtsP/CotA-like multicopper oxidase with cupredoxin domain